MEGIINIMGLEADYVLQGLSCQVYRVPLPGYSRIRNSIQLITQNYSSGLVRRIWSTNANLELKEILLITTTETSGPGEALIPMCPRNRGN